MPIENLKKQHSVRREGQQRRAMQFANTCYLPGRSTRAVVLGYAARWTCRPADEQAGSDPATGLGP